jgi:hypothetical protein
MNALNTRTLLVQQLRRFGYNNHWEKIQEIMCNDLSGILLSRPGTWHLATKILIKADFFPVNPPLRRASFLAYNSRLPSANRTIVLLSNG